MRTTVIVFIAVGVWLPGLAHAQDSTCDARTEVSGGYSRRVGYSP